MLSGIRRMSLISLPALATLSFSFFWAQAGKTLNARSIAIGIQCLIIIYPRSEDTPERPGEKLFRSLPELLCHGGPRQAFIPGIPPRQAGDPPAGGRIDDAHPH